MVETRKIQQRFPLHFFGSNFHFSKLSPFFWGCYIIQNEDCVNQAIYWDTMEDQDAFSGPLFFIDVWVVSSVYIHGLTEVVGHHWECQWLSSSLVGGIPTPLKNMKVSWDDDIPNIWKNKTCSKPPTRSSINGLNPMIKPMVWKIMQYLFGFIIASRKLQWHRSECWLLIRTSWIPENASHILFRFCQHLATGWNKEFHTWHYPLVNCPKTMENHNFSRLNQIFLWPCSIAFCMFTRGYPALRQLQLCHSRRRNGLWCHLWHITNGLHGALHPAGRIDPWFIGILSGIVDGMWTEHATFFGEQWVQVFGCICGYKHCCTWGKQG